TRAVQNIFAGGSFAHLNDAVSESILMLKRRPGTRRRILLLISETRDYGSSATARDDVIELQFNNIQVYQVTMSRLLGKLTTSPEARFDNTPPAMHPMPPGVAATPTSVMQTYGTEGNSAEFIPLLLELYRDAKSIFKSTPAQVFTKATGGEMLPFFGGKGLQEAIQKIGEQLHSEYTLSYNPTAATKAEGGFHRIEVTVTGHPEVPIKGGVSVRPGYWTATH
ncbi:MAG TPA: hypothetical protein VG456_06930, partial [Candidatus Sulfopaludibacter sp.]|nr:hypothetical protein [Candidatus Sulfopaludibacter sp.]